MRQSYRTALKLLGNAEKLEAQRWRNNRMQP